MLKTIKITGLEEATHFLRGGILGSPIKGNVGLPLVGKTVSFEEPPFSHTFVAVATTTRDGSYLLYTDIKSQIEAAEPTLKVTSFGGRIGFIKRTPTSATKMLAPSAGGAAVRIGTVDVNELVFGAGGTLDGKVLNLKINGVAKGVTFAAPTNRQDVLDQINAVIDPTGVASLYGSTYLSIATTDVGDSKTVQVVGGNAAALLGLATGTTTGAATNEANALLGFSGAASGTVISKSGGSSPTLEFMSSTIDNTVVLVIDE